MRHLILFLLALPGAHAEPWKASAGVAVKEAYDDNVFLQDYGEQARRKSWVTSVTPSIGTTFQPSPAFKASLSYAPEVVRYHHEPSENHVAHRWSANLGGKSEGTAWELPNSAVWIDGSRSGPTYTRSGAAAEVPALGGIPVRDRRDALILRNGFKLTRSLGPLFIRPVFSSYAHEFRTLQRNQTGYENYVDRYELGGGMDAGAGDKTKFFLGYRVGRQQQSELLGAPSPYSNTYHRALAGLEGAPAGWLKLNLLAGPDFRHFNTGVPSGFHRKRTLPYYDVSVTVLPTSRDALSASSRRYAQPAFSSHSVYEDLVHEFTAKHAFGETVSAGAGFKIYAGLWLQPAQRRDWVYTSSAWLSLTPVKGVSADLSYSRDWASSATANKDGREYKRHLVFLGLKYGI
ncbi:MAG: hypothetical protein WC728_08205 [Elusimicrobiota bacterium]